jgi:DNA polymerase III alpha subunit (gram-positive type)
MQFDPVSEVVGEDYIVTTGTIATVNARTSTAHARSSIENQAH